MPGKIALLRLLFKAHTFQPRIPESYNPTGTVQLSPFPMEIQVLQLTQDALPVFPDILQTYSCGTYGVLATPEILP